MNRYNRSWLLLCLIAASLIVAACAAPAPAPTDTPSAPSAPSATAEPAATPAVAPPPTTAAAQGAVPTDTISMPIVQGGAEAATPAPSSQAGAGHLEGTVQYSADATPDPDSVIEVQLMDTTTFDVVASQTIEMPAPEAKVPFAVDYDPAKINSQHAYGLVALVTVGPDVKWATGDPLPVLAAGQPAAGLVLTVNAVPVATAPQPPAPSADAGAPAAQPTPVPAAPTAPSTANTVNGTLTYSSGALDPNAVIEVQLRDVSLPNSPGQIVAAQTINAAGQQAPIAFAVAYDPARIDQSHYYLVFARVTVNSQLSWFSPEAVYVLTFNNPTTVEVLLQPVKP